MKRSAKKKTAAETTGPKPARTVSPRRTAGRAQLELPGAEPGIGPGEGRDAPIREQPGEVRSPNLFELHPQPMWIYDLETLRFLAVNTAATAHYGYSRDEFLNLTIADLRPVEDVSGRLEVRKNVTAMLAPAGVERHRHKDGRLMQVELSSRPLEFAGRRAALVLGLDVTERLATAAALRHSNEEYERQYAALAALTHKGFSLAGDERAALREIVETVAGALNVERVSHWRFNPDRTAIVCQDLFEASQSRHTSEQVLRARDFPAYFRSLGESEVIAADDARSDPRTREFRASYLEPQGITAMLDAPVLIAGALDGVLCIEQVGSPRQWTHGEQSFAVSAASLVALVIVQRAQARSESRLRTIFESEPECVKIVSAEGALLDMNPAGLRMIEADQGGEVLNRPVLELIHPEDHAAFTGLHRRASGGETGQLQYRIVGRKGTVRWVETHSAPLREAGGTGGRTTSVLSVTRDITARRLAEAALRASEASMAIAQRIAHFGSWELELTHPDLNTNPLRWSDEMFRIAGCEPGSVPVSNELFFRLVPPDDHQLIRQAVAEAIRERRSYSIVHRLIRPSGEERVVHEVAQIFFDEQTGQPVKMVGTAHDITDQRRAEEQLRRTEELYRRAISGAGAVPYASEFKTGAYVFMGEGIRQLIGYEPAEMSPALWGEIAQEFVMQGEAAGLSREEAARRMLTGQLHHWRCDMRVITRTGETRWIADASVQDVDAAGQPTGALGILQDITERKRAEAELRERESEQRLLAMQLAEVQAVGKLGSWRTDLATLQVEWSAETYRIFETTPEQFQPTHQAFLQFVHPDDRAEVEAALAHSIEHRAPCSLEHRLLLPDGRIKHVEERWQTFVDGVGRPLRATGMCLDITERKRAERQVTAFAALGAKLGAAASAEEAARIIVQTADDLLGWDACWLHLYDAARDQSQSVLNIDIVNGRRESVPPAYEDTTPSPMIRRVLHEGAQLILREQPVVDPAQLAPFGDTARPSASIMIAPVRYDGKVIAVLSIQSYTVRAYRPEDLKALEALADHCGGALARIRAHTARLETEERYRALFDRSLDAVYLHDLEGRFVDANPTAVQLLGYERDDISRLTFADILADPADLARAQRSIALKLAGDHSEGVTTYRLKHQDGTYLWVELTSTLVLANGRPVAIQGIARDITARVRAEQALRESEARFQAFMHDSPSVAFMKDANGRYVYANAATLRLFHITLDQLLGQTDFALLPEPVARQLRDNDQHVLTTGQPLQTIEHVPNEAGEMATWQVWKFPFHDDVQGRCVGGLAFDITERQRAEERIAEQAALLDAAHEAILVKDLDDRIVFWNKGAERLYGWTATEVLGRTTRELLSPDPTVFQTALDHLRQHGEWRGEMTKQTKAGRPVQIEVRWTLVRDPAGEPKSVLAINSDITEKKQFEAHFLRAQRMESIGTLAGGIAHDLNNVLAPILMAVQVLQETVTTPEGQAVLATLESSAQRGADLVKQVLAFARGIEGQRLVLNPMHIARDIRKIMQDTFPKNIELSLETARDLRTVLGDPTQLHQVLMNLCVNARDAMPAGGKLAITLANRTIDDVYAGMNLDSRPGEYVLIEVTDTGVGMAAEIREKIFEPFFTTKEIGKGTGLGLSTTLAIVRSHGGFINVYSEVGKGTRFKVYLPAQTGPATETAIPEQNRLPRGQGELILVVDDEASIRKVAQKTLERYGYRVLLAVNGAEGVSLYASHREEVAVVLTDMAMPVMDGPTMIIALKNINPLVKIIGSSGLASSDSVSRIVGSKVPHFIPKPYTAENMLRTLAAVLRESNAAT